MDYEKSPTATAFSRKITNRSHSHSFSFSANAVYDGVFASPMNNKSSLVDYGEIFRGSGPSPSSIPFLDIPELTGGKIKVDVRSSKLDYSSVFGGFGACDFAVTPKEMIIKSEMKTTRNEDTKRKRRNGGNSSDIPLCKEGNDLTSSPEMVKMKNSDISYHQTGLRNENVTNQVFTMPGPTQLVDNMSPLQKIEIKTPIPSVEKKTSQDSCEEMVALRKPDVEHENIFGQNGCSTRDNFTCKTNSNSEHWDVKPLSSLHHTLNGENGDFQTEDADSPSSPTYFDAETDPNSAAAESSAALKKAIDEAQVRMNIAKQMMERKKSGSRRSAKPKSCDDPKVENEGDKKVKEITEENRDNTSQIPGEMVKSSEQSSSNEKDQQAKRARKLWKVPEGLIKSTSDNKREKLEEQDAVKLEEEHAKKGRKHWELPGGIFKSAMNSKQEEPEAIAPAKPETDNKQEVKPLTEYPFYKFAQLGSKIKCVVEVFTGGKVSQNDEKQVIEKEHSQMVQDEENDSQEMLAGIPVMETYLREVEETPQQTESKSGTKVEEKSETTMSTFTEGSSQKIEKETGSRVQSCCESEGGPNYGVKDFQEPEPNYNVLDHEGGKDTVSGPQEMFDGTNDNKTYEREVEAITTPNQSLSEIQFDDSVGTMVSFHTDNISEPENIDEVKETVHKAPRRRRVWKTSEDVYSMIKAPKGNNMPWQLESSENETTERSFREEGVRNYNVSEERESTSGQASDSGLQENWTALKHMFRQVFQTADTKGEEETFYLVESEKDHIDIHQKAGDENGKETAETSYCQMTETDRYVHDKVETVSTDYEAYAHTRGNIDLESASERYCRKEDGKVEVQGKPSLVRELIGEELEAVGMASDQEGEDVQDVSEEAGLAEGHSKFNEITEHTETRSEILGYDRSETDSNKSGEKSKQPQELADETKIDGSIDTDTSRSSFDNDSHIEEVSVEQDLGDQFPEKSSAASSMEEHIEEMDSDSIQSGWSVVDDDDKVKSYVEERRAGNLQDRGASSPEKMEETKEETDEMKTRLGVENNEVKTEQKHHFECSENAIDRSNVEAAESSCFLPNTDEKIGEATDRNIKDNDGEESCRSSMEEEGDATSDASQHEAEVVEKHLKKKDEAKEKERERVMVERAIREARERAFADAKERAGKAALEKAKAGAPRRGTSEVPRRSEKRSVEVNNKLSSEEKESMQAKLRSERAAVERALSEARERAMEKALSAKFAASQSQARSYGGSKSFGSSGPSNSSNQTAKGEPAQRCKARSERQQRTSERAAEALAEKKLRDLKAQKEQAERNRLAESLDADVKRWSSGKEKNLRALLSTLQYILGKESGWIPIPLTDLVTSASVRKAYRKATLYVHPDKLQQRGASTQQKYICEKVFDLLKEAWNKFGADER